MTDAAPTRRSRRRGPVPIRHGRLRRSRASAAIAKVLAAVLGVSLVSAGSLAAIAAWDVASTVKPGIHLAHLASVGTKSQGAKAATIDAISGGVNLLVTGTDTRTGQGGAYQSKSELAGSSGAGNNDVTLLLHISSDHKNASVISIPRDMMLPIPSCPTASGGHTYAQSKAMMNTTLATGGLSCVVLTVEKLTGVSIPYAAEISFDGVSAMSNAVGGVQVCIASPVVDKYTNPALNLAAGEQTIVGDEALSFLRSRHGVGDGSDLGRISNQQVFMSALARKVVSGGVLGNPVQLYSLAKAAVSNMSLSDTLTDPTTLVQIGLALKNIGLPNIVFLQYPAVTDPDNPNRVVPAYTAAKAVNTALLNDQPLQLTGTVGVAAQYAPGTTPTPTPTPSSSAATGAGASSTPASGATTTTTPATPSPTSTAAVLPSNVTGQTAAQQTCTKGN